MKNIIVMCPTVKRANYEFRSFCEKWIEIIDKVKSYEVTLIDGRKIMFRGETEGQKVIRGFHGDIISISEFEFEIKS